MRVSICLALAVALIGGCAAEGGRNVEPGAVVWKTFVDEEHHFRLEYPASWKVNAERVTVAHYTDVLASLNSAGKDRFTVREVQIGPGSWEFGPESIAPAGAGGERVRRGQLV